MIRIVYGMDMDIDTGIYPISNANPTHLKITKGRDGGYEKNLI